MKVAIVGYGTEGKAAAHYWDAKGADITILDENKDTVVPDGTKAVVGPDCLNDLSDYDLVVRSPGVHPKKLATAAKVTSGMNEFLEQCPAMVIGVTGTKGKGTTSSLIAQIVERQGFKVWLGGNIGTPVLDFLDQIGPKDIAVIEMSSFQLMDVTRSPHIAICLAISPDHLDWHTSQAEYIQAKGNIFRYQSAEDLAIYNPHNDSSVSLVGSSPGRHIPYLEKPGCIVTENTIEIDGSAICKTSEVGLIGPFNLENVCAAVTATWDLDGHDALPLRQAIRKFTGLPHRLEVVGGKDGVTYVNDSFSSNPLSTIAAIKAFDAPKVMILGGLSRGVNLHQLARAVAQGNVKSAVLIGSTAQDLKEALAQVKFTSVELAGGTMPEIVAAAASKANPGDVVLLSPGFPSFDMFRNFTDRGEQFKTAVTNLGVTK